LRLQPFAASLTLLVVRMHDKDAEMELCLSQLTGRRCVSWSRDTVFIFGLETPFILSRAAAAHTQTRLGWWCREVLQIITLVNHRKAKGKYDHKSPPRPS
jgi:hypothetical protein